MDMYLIAAQQGLSSAQYNILVLGWHYQNGKGVPKDDAKGLEWYLKAAEQGHPESQFSLVRFTVMDREFQETSQKQRNGF